MCDDVEKNFKKSREENYTNKILFEILSRLDSLDELNERVGRIERKIKDIEEDRRADLSIARATRRMKFFEKMPQEL